MKYKEKNCGLGCCIFCWCPLEWNGWWSIRV